MRRIKLTVFLASIVASTIITVVLFPRFTPSVLRIIPGIHPSLTPSAPRPPARIPNMVLELQGHCRRMLWNLRVPISDGTKGTCEAYFREAAQYPDLLRHPVHQLIVDYARYRGMSTTPAPAPPHTPFP